MNQRIIKYTKIALGPLMGLAILLFTDLSPGNPLVTRMAAVAVWMAWWWLSEAFDLAVTALIPVLFLPLLGIVPVEITLAQYIDKVIFLFAGGFVIALAIEKWELHKRIALKILMTVGSRPSDILFGVMLTSFLLSMWISNTATTLMLLSAVMAVIYEVEKHIKDPKQLKRIAAVLLIGLAYAASIGGMATLVGTPTNMIFFGKYQDAFPGNKDVSFASWFAIGFPLASVFMLISFLVMWMLFIRQNKKGVDKSYFRNEFAKLGRMGREEKMVLSVFITTAVLWFFRADIVFDSFTIPGWKNIFPESEWVHDSTVAAVMALLLFLLPSSKTGKQLIAVRDLKKFPYGVLLLFGGGFALAKGFETSGLSTWIAQRADLASLGNIYLVIFVMCVLICVISEFASNVACIQLMIPILLSIQNDMGLHPLTLLLPATLASSLGFMLPVATAPNTIVFGTRRLHAGDMLKAGIFLDLLGAILITLAMMAIDYIKL